MKRINKSRSAVLLALSALTLTALVGCNPTDKPGPGPDPDPVVDPDKPEQAVTLGTNYVVTNRDSTYFSPHLVSSVSDEGPEYVSAKSAALVESGETDYLYAYGVPEGYSLGVTVLDETGNVVDGIVDGSGRVTAPSVTEETNYKIYLFGVSADETTTIKKALDYTVVPSGTIAKGEYFDYSGLDGVQRSKMAGIEESFLFNNGVAQINYMQDASYSLYSERLHSPFLDKNYYVPGYGYGVLDYGTIDAPMTGELTERFQYYLHSQFDASQEQGTFNYLASNNNSVSTLYSYISSTYFNQYVNEDETGASYQSGLSRLPAPEAVNPDENGASTTWKIYLRVGGATANEATGVTPGLNYRINTNDSVLKEFNNRPIQLKDYLTPFKLLATQKIGWFRGSEQAAEETVNRQIKGFSEFYASTAEATDLVSDEEFMSKVGVKIDSTDNSLTIEFNGKVSPDYAEYQLNGIWANPMSEEFIRALGGGDVIAGAAIYGASSSDGKSPQDTTLSVGPYYLDYYESKKTIAYTKNESWPLTKDDYGRDLYQIPGIHLNINSSLNTNPNATIEMFEAGLTDSSNIPDEYWDKYLTSPLRRQEEGTSTYPMYINTWDKAWWDERFGPLNEKGWEVKPILSNNNFYKGLFVGLDRLGVSDYYHYSPTVDLMDPHAKVSPKAETTYNSSEDHQNALESAFGNSLDDLSLFKNNAAEYFEVAIQEELDAGHYKLGTEESPTNIKIQFASADTTNTIYRENLMFAGWSEAFNLAVTSHVNSEGVNDWVGPTGKPLITLSFEAERYSSADSTAMNTGILDNGVKIGKYDGQGVWGVIGNPYDVLNNLSRYKSDDSSTFTYGFGLDTSIPSKFVKYNDKYWSFDSLWQAANGGVLLDEDGKQVPFFTTDFPNVISETGNADEGFSWVINATYNPDYVSNIVFSLRLKQSDGSVKFEPVDVVFNGDGTATLSVPAGKLPTLADAGYTGDGYYVEMSVTYDVTVSGQTSSKSAAYGPYGWSF